MARKRGTKRAPPVVSSRALRVGRQRRVVLPQEIFAAAGWTEGTPLQAEVSADGAVTLRPAPERRAEAAEYLRRHWRALHTNSRAFLAHRRREAKREQ